MISIIVYFARQCALSNKGKASLQWLKHKVFYTPIIRFATLNSLKFDLAAILALKAIDKSATDKASAVATLVIPILIITALSVCMSMNQTSLDKPEIRKYYGALYQGKNVTNKARL